jgi:hypothetical protein
MASPFEFTESTQSFLFPTLESLKSKIPLWMRFYAFSYTQNALNRFEASKRGAGEFNIPTLSNMLLNIVVPAQISLITTTSPSFKHKTTDATTSTPPLFGIGGIKQTFDDFIGNIGSYIEELGSDIIQEMGYGGAMPEPDMYDLTFAGGGPSRSFNVTVNLPCFTTSDSKMAADIANAFEAYSLPTGTSWGNIANTKFYHPPLWSFGNSVSLNSTQINKAWTGQPQLSVLTAVKTKRIPLESSSVVGVGNDIDPMVYSISLAFTELEPSVRLRGSQITSRSGLIAAGRSQTLGLR